ncbi:MAG TPA: RluA family pseudouridine synthase [bacterium]|nr:RluA family pseudouridine synthase [bacterium]
MKKTFIFEGDKSERLDKFLTAKLKKHSRSQIQNWTKNGQISVNGKIIDAPHHWLTPNDEIVCVFDSKKAEPDDLANAPQIKIIKIDRNFLIIDKPAGLATHGSKDLKQSSVVQQLLEKYPELKEIGDDPLRPGIVHRLDKQVSGLLVVARTKKMFDYLKKQFQERLVKKTYIALAFGIPGQNTGSLNFKLERSKDKKRMIAKPAGADSGKESLTEYELIKTYKHFSLLKVNLKTGRTHQIRAHFHAFGHALVGDPLYKQKKYRPINLGRIFLHAQELEFVDMKGEKQAFYSKLPMPLKTFLNEINPLKNILIVSGASGAGKSTIIIDVLKNHKGLNLQTGATYTTRAPREIPEDKQVINVSKEEFESLIEKNRVIEYAWVHENYYGTARDILENTIKTNNIVLNIDIQGALQIQKQYPEAWLIFIDAPLKDLEKRLRGRGSNTEEDIKIRLANAAEEKTFCQYYDVVIENKSGKMDKAVAEFVEFVKRLP